MAVSVGCSSEHVTDNNPPEGGSGGSSGEAGLDGGSDAADASDGDAASRTHLDPLSIPKFQEALVVPPAMPPVRTVDAVAEYEIAVRQFEQQMLPLGFPKTTVWGYGKAGDPLPGTGGASTYHTPAFTIEGRSNTPIRVKWINGLVADDGSFLPHLLAVDQTLHWANPAGVSGMRGTDQTPYTGPVPIVTHMHGGHALSTSDGLPGAWYMPAANDLPAGYATRGPGYGTVTDVGEGAALFEYPNDQREATLWYHDHALGMTRLNVYAGLAGFYLLRDDEEDALGLPGPAPRVGDAAGTRYYEIPIAIQDRTFHEDGSLSYPSSRGEFDGYQGPYSPETPVSPIWNPEVFGDTIVVNGRTWPYFEAEPRLYRFRLLNGCNARFLILTFGQAGLSFHQIGTEGGLLADAPVERDQIVLAPGERADVIVDFSSLSVGTEVKLFNVGPDEPYKGPNVELDPANPDTTGQVMLFRIVAATTQGTAGQIPTSLPPVDVLSTSLAPRDLTLNEEVYPEADIPYAAELGTASAGPLDWDDPVTETPTVGDTEIWRLINLTEDAHPIHLHLVQFRVLDRTPFDKEAYASAQRAYLDGSGTQPAITDFFVGPAVGPLPGESGFKDTVVANPGEVLRIIATFDIAGKYVWHCHLLEHEDNEMMRPYEILPAP